MTEIAEKAKEAKKQLQKAFPDVKFSVTSNKDNCIHLGSISESRASCSRSVGGKERVSGHILVKTDTIFSEDDKKKACSILDELKCSYAFNYKTR